jgi:puromycin-sensitive aminopeptidase
LAQGFTKENVRIRIYCPPGLSSQGAFALKVGTETLSFFTEYFGIPYPLPKLDMVAIPDFAAGAVCG